MKDMNGRINMNGKAIYGKGHSYIQAKPTDYVEETNNMQCEAMNNCCTSCCTGS
jgi:hypothetical protein